MDKELEPLGQRTKAFALRIIRLYRALPKSVDAQVLGKQVLRSGTSIGANYREAYRARSNVEFMAKMGDCLKELEETTYWLEILFDAEILPPEKLSAICDESKQLTAIFVTILKRRNK